MAKSLIPLTAIPFIWALSNSMLIPILPEIKKEFSLTSFQTGLILTALSVPAGLLLPIAGYLSDIYGRKPVILFGTVLYGFAGIFIFLTQLFFPSYHLLLVGRVIQGIGAAGTNLLAIAFVADLYQDRKRAEYLGYLETSNSIGKLISPLLGSLAALGGWFITFLVYPLLSLPTAILSLLWLPHKKPDTPPGHLKAYIHKFKELLAGKTIEIAVFLFAAFLTVFLWFGNLFLLSEISAEVIKVGGLWRGILLSVPVVSLALSAYITGKYLTRLNKTSLTALGLICIGISLLLMTFLAKHILIYVASILLGIGVGLVLPTLDNIITSSVPDNHRGLLTTIFGTLRSFGSAFGPPLTGLLLNYNAIVALGTGSVTALLLALIVWRMPKTG